MKFTETFRTEYEKMIEAILDKKNKVSEKEIGLFTLAVGRKYDSQFLIYGRATNGWYGDDFAEYGGVNTILNVNKNTEGLIGDIAHNFENLNTDWIKEKWQNGEKSATSRSPFFRFTHKISKNIGKVGFEEIAWSNLYKASKAEERNPSKALKKAQFNFSKNLFLNEIEALKPKYVILLTGLKDWAEPFIENLERKKVNGEFIKAIAKYGDSKVIVSEHPQGRSEAKHLEEIKQAIEEFDL